MTIVKKLILITAVIALVVGGIVVVTVDRASAQGRPYDNRNLRGTYHFNFVQISVNSGVVYCEEYGMATFDGIGTVDVTSRRRCNGLTPSDESSSVPYLVDPDGSFVIYTAFGSSEVQSHGQIVDGGRMILIDGVEIDTGDVYVQHGVGVKQ